MERKMGHKEDEAKKVGLRLGLLKNTRLSQSMDNLCVRREKAKTVVPAAVSKVNGISKSTVSLCSESEEPNIMPRNISKVTERLSKATDNLCSEREESHIMPRNISKVTERLSKSTDNLCSEREEPSIMSRNISKMNERLSKSTDNLCTGKKEINVVPRIISKVTDRLSKSVDNIFLKDQKENYKPRFLSKATKVLGMKLFRKKRQKEANRRHNTPEHFDFYEIDSDATDDDNDDNLEFHPDGGDGEELYGYKDIRTSHYAEASRRETCTNPSCNAVFSFHVHPHHCRRCGEIFCSSCLRLRRNLNRLAQPDPDGLPCKVCETCFHENDETASITSRSLTEDFVNMRTKARSERNDIYCEVTIERRMASVVPVFWREQFKIDIQQECRRLLEGFKEAVNSSEKYVRKTVQELRKLVDVPAWQKSVYWTLEKTVSSCRLCHTRFRKFHKQQKLRNCRVCGLALCKACANKELLVYFEDSEVNNNDKGPKVSIIKFEGCPEVEPELSVLLYVCSDCKSEILQRQLKDTGWFEDKPEQVHVISQVVELHEEIAILQETVKQTEDQVQRLTQETDRTLQREAHISLLSLAMKMHRHTMLFDTNILEQIDDGITDLEAALSKFPAYINKLKEFLKCDAGSTKEVTLLGNLLKGKCDFYLQHKQILCELRKKTGTLLKLSDN